ncbi:MAG: nucleoside deaminase [Candidatus Micrarchaeota archaeon]|nr:nucleoside deaminase [Candidatus Micrarchaeota archaeon]
MKEEKFMRLAIGAALKGIKSGGAPFGACIVKGGRAVAIAHNSVWQKSDITAHAEIEAIRQACKRLRAISLAGSEIYSTCEPCPMCFSAIHWAKIGKIIYGASISDAKKAGFCEISLSNSRLKRLGRCKVRIKGGFLKEECKRLFSLFAKKGGAQKTY